MFGEAVGVDVLVIAVGVLCVGVLWLFGMEKSACVCALNFSSVSVFSLFLGFSGITIKRKGGTSEFEERILEKENSYKFEKQKNKAAAVP